MIKLFAKWRRAEPAVAVDHGRPGRIPTVKFDASQVTADVKRDIQRCLEERPELTPNTAAKLYRPAVDAISRGGDLHFLRNAILECHPKLSPNRAGMIARDVTFRAWALMDKNRLLKTGIETAVWKYANAPCTHGWGEPTADELRQDEAHKAADGIVFSVKDGLLVGGVWTHPGCEIGCKCFAKPVIPGFS